MVGITNTSLISIPKGQTEETLLELTFFSGLRLVEIVVTTTLRCPVSGAVPVEFLVTGTTVSVLKTRVRASGGSTIVGGAGAASTN